MAQSKDRQVKDTRARILLVDDHAVVRYGIAQLINRQSDLVVCGEEEDASRAMTAIAALKPDLVIADISLKDSSGLELMRNIKAQYPKLPVLVVSVHEESIYAEIAFRAGALGYLMKEEAVEKILNAIRRVLSGSIYVSDAQAARMLQQQVRGQSSRVSFPPCAPSLCAPDCCAPLRRASCTQHMKGTCIIRDTIELPPILSKRLAPTPFRSQRSRHSLAPLRSRPLRPLLRTGAN